MRTGVAITLGVLAVAVAARVALPVPLSPVPITLQSLAVLLVGFALGPAAGTAAMVAYVVAGALGLPVLADGRAGWDAVTGPSAGYLLGFVAAPSVIAAAGRRPGLRDATLAAFGAHAVILALGAAWLVVGIGMAPADAISRGVTPFLAGMALKSVVAALAVVAIRRVAGARAPGS